MPLSIPTQAINNVKQHRDKPPEHRVTPRGEDGLHGCHTHTYAAPDGGPYSIFTSTVPNLVGRRAEQHSASSSSGLSLCAPQQNELRIKTGSDACLCV
ncbi:unnamed protein product [Leuciscus chuanchicus]